MNTTIQINSRGTLTLPKALRRAIGLAHGGTVVAETSDQGIVLRPSVTFPVEMYTDERVAEFDAADAELGPAHEAEAKMRVFLDANILFSAASIDSPTRQLLETILRHGEAVTNEHAWEEARRNVACKRPHLTDELDRLKPRIELTNKLTAAGSLALLDDDRPIVGGAIASRCSHLWTGDKRHFGPLYGRTIHGTRIVSGVMLADEVASRGWHN